jgi:GPH family glycoside/pentoside/hexuronide:cation symporter
MGFIIAMIIWGTVLGGVWVMQLPILGDVIDESVCITGKREEGIYMGFNQFFSRLAIVAQAISFAIVHSLTGFVEGADTQSAQALVGIHIHFAVVPLFAMLAGVIIFWKLYDLTPEKVLANQAKVKELCL